MYALNAYDRIKEFTMYEENNRAAFAFLITALSVGISIPALVGDDIKNFVVAVSVFALGKFVYCLEEMVRLSSIFQTVMYFCGALFGAIAIMLCFVVFAGEEANASHGIAYVLFGVSSYYIFIDGLRWAIEVIRCGVFSMNLRSVLDPNKKM